MLSKFVSFKTIADDENREECRQGALFLKNIFKQFGASTVLVRASAVIFSRMTLADIM
jgi:hypothetical protein